MIKKNGSCCAESMGREGDYQRETSGGWELVSPVCLNAECWCSAAGAMQVGFSTSGKFVFFFSSGKK